MATDKVDKNGYWEEKTNSIQSQTLQKIAASRHAKVRQLTFVWHVFIRISSFYLYKNWMRKDEISLV